MKIIISHDVDYMTFTEHFRDLTIPKYLIRGFIERCSGVITSAELVERFRSLFSNKFQNTFELLHYDRRNQVPATVFIAVNRGRNGLNYSLKQAAACIRSVKQLGFDVGVHGIAFQRSETIQSEKKIFESIVRHSVQGIRIHYVKTNANTYAFLEKAGYRYDSTDVGQFKSPYRIAGMWEFPVNLMDSFLINAGRPWQSVTLAEAKQHTVDLIDMALERQLPYFNILFHDNHFSDAFLTWKKWYLWLIGYLRDNHFAFVDYRQAIAELEVSQS